jgi:organic hydroperoxide reductase OsmC/OhrA
MVGAAAFESGLPPRVGLPSSTHREIFLEESEAAMAREHDYTCMIEWTGNRGQGTKAYRGYDRTWDITTPGKPVIHCSNDPLLGGDPGLPNPEDLLLCALSSCHMLWYLHLASTAGIVVHAYEDQPLGIGEAEPSGAGRFLRAVLRPRITLAPGTDHADADAIHHRIHDYCFIARSVNFPIAFEAAYREADMSSTD